MKIRRLEKLDTTRVDTGITIAGPVASPEMTRVSNQTNNTDPLAVNSRIFVGNLNTYVVEKENVEQMFRRYGRVIGISMHKGYAFVQFTDAYDARNAVLGEDGRTLAGQILDVNMVSEPKPHQLSRKRHQGSSRNNISSETLVYGLRTSANTTPPVKRLRNDLLSLTPAAMYIHNGSPGIPTSGGSTVGGPNSSLLGGAAPPGGILSPGRPHSRSGKLPPPPTSPLSSAPNLTLTGIFCTDPDLLVCGTCKELFTSLQGLLDHKQEPCRLRFTCRCQDNGLNETAPPTPACAHCNAQFSTWWDLTYHVETAHGIAIYRHDDECQNGSGEGSSSSSSSSLMSADSAIDAGTNTQLTNGNSNDQIDDLKQDCEEIDQVRNDHEMTDAEQELCSVDQESEKLLLTHLTEEIASVVQQETTDKSVGTEDLINGRTEVLGLSEG